ncbi:hypothetical protein [Sphingomonas morindae]|uniref:Uncharacterized protein n=1 Tax=Sphingomonas morindae TaxID=1541170 RepID=A0ABY4X9A7_9SPHN|nr:hypothetical protein [Sphingomonas morindae]USI73478.1 hypothetical protein LHA26_03065 [Sphingomonas morindae]
MGMIFDPVRKKEYYLQNKLSYELNQTYNENRSMGNHACHSIEGVISAWLVGLHAEIAPVLPRSLDWIDKALANGEVNRFGPDPNGHSTTLHWAKAIGHWMLTGEDDSYEWDLTRCFEEARWRFPERPWPTNEIVRDGLDDYMAFTVGAGPHAKYEYGPESEIYMAGIDMYERWTGKSGPIKLGGTLKPREFGYALCRHYTCVQNFDEDELFAAGRKMLRANLQETWLGGGQYMLAATWLKIVYHQLRGEADPLRCILHAYDDMPDVSRPAFV